MNVPRQDYYMSVERMGPSSIHRPPPLAFLLALAKFFLSSPQNRGLYIKAGQSIGIQVAILPKPYHALAQIFDAAPQLPYEDVRNVIYEELGMYPEELFREFDQVPIRAAVSPFLYSSLPAFLLPLLSFRFVQSSYPHGLVEMLIG
jgi:hypothetical protein